MASPGDHARGNCELEDGDAHSHQNDETTPSSDDMPDITDDFAPQTELDTQEEDRFNVGDIVMVMRRMWPGMNNPGGVGRIAAIHFIPDEDTHVYEVHYVLGGKEMKVEGKYMKIHVEDAERGRSTRGRCRWCGSFIRDCQHDPLVDPTPVPIAPPPKIIDIKARAQKGERKRTAIARRKVFLSELTDERFASVDQTTKEHGGTNNQTMHVEDHNPDDVDDESSVEDSGDGDGDGDNDSDYNENEPQMEVTTGYDDAIEMGTDDDEVFVGGMARAAFRKRAKVADDSQPAVTSTVSMQVLVTSAVSSASRPTAANIAEIPPSMSVPSVVPAVPSGISSRVAALDGGENTRPTPQPRPSAGAQGQALPFSQPVPRQQQHIAHPTAAAPKASHIATAQVHYSATENQREAGSAAAAVHTTAPFMPRTADNDDAVIIHDVGQYTRDILAGIKNSVVASMTVESTEDTFINNTGRDQFAYVKKVSQVPVNVLVEMLGQLNQNIDDWCKKSEDITTHAVDVHRKLFRLDPLGCDDRNLRLSMAELVLSVQDDQISLFTMLARAGKDVYNKAIKRCKVASIRAAIHADCELRKKKRVFESQNRVIIDKCNEAETACIRAVKRVQEAFQDKFGCLAVDAVEDGDESDNDDNDDGYGSGSDHGGYNDFTGQPLSGITRGHSLGRSGSGSGNRVSDKNRVRDAAAEAGTKRKRVRREGDSRSYYSDSNSGTGSDNGNDNSVLYRTASSASSSASILRGTGSTTGTAERGPGSTNRQDRKMSGDDGDSDDDDRMDRVKRTKRSGANEPTHIGRNTANGGAPHQKREYVYSNEPFERRIIGTNRVRSTSRSKLSLSNGNSKRYRQTHRKRGTRVASIFHGTDSRSAFTVSGDVDGGGAEEDGNHGGYNTDEEMNILTGGMTSQLGGNSGGGGGGGGGGGRIRKNHSTRRDSNGNGGGGGGGGGGMTYAQRRRHMFDLSRNGGGSGGSGGGGGRATSTHRTAASDGHRLRDFDDTDIIDFTISSVDGRENAPKKTERQKVHESFYKKVKFVTTMDGTGSVFINEGTGPLQLPPAQHTVRNIGDQTLRGMYGNINSGVGHEVPNIASERLVNLHMSSSFSVKPLSNQLVDRLLCDMSTVDMDNNLDWLYANDTHSTGAQGADAAVMAVDEATVDAALQLRQSSSVGVTTPQNGDGSDDPREAVTTSEADIWAEATVKDICMECSTLPEVVTVVFEDVLTPAIHELRFTLVEFDSLSVTHRRDNTHKSQRNQTQSDELRAVQQSLVYMTATKTQRMNSLLRSVLVQSKDYFSMEEVQFVSLFFAESRRLETLLYTCTVTTSNSQTYHQQQQHNKNKSQVQGSSHDLDSDEGDSGDEDGDETTPAESVHVLGGGDSAICSRLSTFMQSTRDSAADDLWVFLAISYLLGKVAQIQELVMVVVTRAGRRSRVQPKPSNTGESTLKAEEERSDAQILSKCYSEIMAVLSSVLETLVVNKRLMLAVLCFVSESTSSDSGAPFHSFFSTNTVSRTEFIPGIQGRTELFVRLIVCVLSALDKCKASLKSASSQWSQPLSSTEGFLAYDRWKVFRSVLTDLWKTSEVDVGTLSDGLNTMCRVSPSVEVTRFGPAQQASVTVTKTKGSRSAAPRVPVTCAVDSSILSSESLWSLLSLYTLIIQRLMFIETMAKDRSTERTLNFRVDGEWSVTNCIVEMLCKSAASAVVTSCSTTKAATETSPPVATTTATTAAMSHLKKTLSRLSSLAALWTLPRGCFEWFLSVVHTVSPILGQLPIYTDYALTQPDDIDSLLNRQSLSAARNTLVPSGAINRPSVPHLDGKTAVLMCCDNYLCMTTASDTQLSMDDNTVQGSVDGHRLKLHEHLLVITSLLFSTCGLINPYDAYFGTTTSNAGQSNNHSKLSDIEDMRSILQELLTNALTHTETVFPAYSSHGVVRPKNHTMLKTLLKRASETDVFTLVFGGFIANPTFANGLLLCLLVKELTAVLGLEFMTKVVCEGRSYQSTLAQLIESHSQLNYNHPFPPIAMAEGEESVESFRQAQHEVMCKKQQHICLKWFATLVTFNPLPISSGTTSSSDSAHKESTESEDTEKLTQLLDSQQRDISTIGSVTGLTTSAFNNNSILDTEETKLSLLTNLTVYSALLRHVNQAIPGKVKVCGMQYEIVPLPYDLLVGSIALVTRILDSKSGLSMRGSHGLSAAYLGCSIIQYLFQWQQKTAAVIAQCSTQLSQGGDFDQTVLYNLLSHMVQVVPLFDSIIVTLVRDLIPCLKTACAQLGKACSDCDESFTFIHKTMQTITPDSDIRRYLTNGSTNATSGSVYSTVSSATCCYALVTAFTHVVQIIQNRPRLNVPDLDYFGPQFSTNLLKPNEPGYNYVNYTVALAERAVWTPATLHKIVIIELLDRLSMADKHDSNIQLYLKIQYWTSVLRCYWAEEDALSKLPSNTTNNNYQATLVLPYIVELQMLVFSGCLMYPTKPVLFAQIGFYSFVYSVLRLCRGIVDDGALTVMIQTQQQQSQAQNGPIGMANHLTGLNTNTLHNKNAPSQAYRLATALSSAEHHLHSAESTTDTGTASAPTVGLFNEKQCLAFTAAILNSLAMPCDYSVYEIAAVKASTNKPSLASGTAYYNTTTTATASVSQQSRGVVTPAQKAIRDKSGPEERELNTTLTKELFRTLRHLELCYFRSATPARIVAVGMRIKQNIAVNVCLSVVSTPPFTQGSVGRQYIMGPSDMSVFYSEFVMKDVKTLLTEVISKNNSGGIIRGGSLLERESQLVMVNLLVYFQTVCYVPYSTRCKEWYCLLQLLLLLSSKHSGSVSSTTQYTELSEEVSLLWSVGLTLTPAVVKRLRNKYSVDGIFDSVGAKKDLQRLLRDQISSSVSDKIVGKVVEHLTAVLALQPPQLSSITAADEKPLTQLRDYLFTKDDAWIAATKSVGDALPVLQSILTASSGGGGAKKGSGMSGADKCQILKAGVEWMSVREKVMCYCACIGAAFDQL